METIVTNEASVAEDWLQSINKLLKPYGGGGHRIVGMSCKFIHHPILSMSNKIALLQLCFQTKCLLLQLLHMDSIPHSLRDFLTDPNTTFVGIHIQQNSLKLLQEYTLRVNRVLDLHFLAKKWFPLSYIDRHRPSMRALAYGIAGFSKRRSGGNSTMYRDWESRTLDTELIEQASVDSYTSYSIAHKLLTDG